MRSNPEAIEFQSEGLTYAGLRWGDPAQRPVLAIHGWLDNALSFHQLGPALEHCCVWALDMSGHGLSDHRSLDATYNIWDDLPQLEGIVRQLGVERISLVGHSRGATIAALLAAVLGERCERLVLIDGLLPHFLDDRNAGQQLRAFVTERQKYLARNERHFQSIDEFIARRAQYGFSDESARFLAPRALEPSDNGYRLLNDPRLYGASATWLDADKRRQIYATISAPTLSILGDNGLFARRETAQAMLEEAGSALPDFRSVTMPGGHHLHMEQGTALAVAQRVAQFIEGGAVITMGVGAGLGGFRRGVSVTVLGLTVLLAGLNASLVRADLAGDAEIEALVAGIDSRWSTREYRDTQRSVRGFPIPLGAMQKVRGVWRLDRFEAMDGMLRRITWEVSGEAVGDVFDASAKDLESMAVEQWRCSGRTCGNAAEWANRVYQERLLYGRDEFMHYAAFKRSDGTWLTLFSAARTADRQYLHLDIAQPTP